MTPYEREFSFTTTGANDVVELDFPGRCEITKITVVRGGGGNMDTTFYSRKFTSDAFNIERISDNGDTKCRIEMQSDFPVAVGDIITVAATGVGGYNASHRVTAVKYGRKANDVHNVVTIIDTSVAYSADVFVGTATLAIPSEDQALFEVAAITGATPQSSTTATLFTNRDPLPNRNTGVKRKLYAKVANADDYRIAIRAKISVAMGD